MYPFINIFGNEYASYSIMALVGGLLSWALISRIIKRRDVNVNLFWMMILFAFFGMLIGGNILSNIISFKDNIAYFKKLGDELTVFIVLENVLFGSIFYGGMIGSILAAAFYLHRKKVCLGEYLDIYAATIPFFHGFGRIGCFLAGCCYGVESHVGFTFSHSTISSANDVKRFPVQLVEALACFVIFLIIIYLMKKGLLRRRLILVYLLIYSLVRFGLEFLRGDEYRGLFGPLSTSQWISLGLFIIASFLLLQTKLRKNTE